MREYIKKKALLFFVGMGLFGLMGTQVVQAAPIKSLLSPTMQKRLELIQVLVAAGKPVIEFNYKDDPAQLKQAQQIFAVINFVPALISSMDELQDTVPVVPREIAETIMQMQKAMVEANQEFQKAKVAANPDEQAQEVLAGLKKLQAGLEGPGNYLVNLNEKTFKQILTLFEALPELGDKMTIKRRNKQTGQVAAEPISAILTDLFSILKNITDKYSGAFKAMDIVMTKLIEENKALRAEVSSLRSSEDVQNVPALSAEQKEPAVLDDILDF